MKRTLKIYIIFIFFQSAFGNHSFVYADNNIYENPRENRRFGIGIQLGGPTLIASVQADYFLSPTFNIETGMGWVGFYGGFKLFFRQTAWSPYIGAKISLLPELKLFSGEGGWEPSIYAPFGIQYINREGFTFAFESALLITNAISPVWGPFWMGVKLGYHF